LGGDVSVGFDGVSSASEVRALKEKLMPQLRGLRVCVLTDGATFVDQDFVAKLIANGPENFFEHSLSRPASTVGGFEIPVENITVCALTDKPWLAGACPEADMKPYRLTVQRALEMYARVGVLSPEGSQAPAGDPYDTLLVSGMAAHEALHQAQVGSALCAESTRLDELYAAEANAWARDLIRTNDVLIGNGGDPVTFNMVHACNRRVSDALVSGVRAGEIVYVGRSAGTIVASKSIEMSSFTRPECIKHFAVRPSGDARSQHHDASTDLSGEGVALSMLGAFPLLRTALAVRPHFTVEEWGAAVRAKNSMAEKEYEEETGKELDDLTVASSACSLVEAVRIANEVSGSSTQDHPLYVPLYEGQAIICRVTPAKETFVACLPKAEGADSR